MINSTKTDIDDLVSIATKTAKEVIYNEEGTLIVPLKTFFDNYSEILRTRYNNAKGPFFANLRVNFKGKNTCLYADFLEYLNILRYNLSHTIQ